MKSVTQTTRDQARFVSELVCRVVRLPAVPTTDWAQTAAVALLPLAGGGPVVVGLGSVTASGGMTNLEDAGVASAVQTSGLSLRALLDPSRSGWPVGGEHDPPADTLVHLTPTQELPRDIQAVWRPLGTEAVMAGSVPLTPEFPARRLIVLIGLTADDAVSSSSRGVTLAAVLAPLARRMALAFGTHETFNRANRLTTREQEVLDRLLLGKSVKQIAEELERSPHTVHDHVKSLHHKLDANSRGALVARALGHGEASPLAPIEPVVLPISSAALTV